MKKLKDYIYPIVILLSAVILAGTYFYVQNNKQENERVEKLHLEWKLESCLQETENEYWKYMRTNGDEKADGLILADERFWNTAERDKKNKDNNCFKRYR